MIDLCASSIAWSPAQDEEIALRLRRRGFTAIELAASKIFAHPAHTSPGEAREYRTKWERHGIRIASLQSLALGRPKLKLFGSNPERAEFAAHLRSMGELAARLGARVMVLGAPQSRLRAGLDSTQALRVAIDFFGALAPYFAGLGVTLCPEPVPIEYGCDFVNTHREAADLVQAVGSPGLGLQLDLYCAQAAGEPLDELLTQYADRLVHVHVSARNLGPLADDGTTRSRIALLWTGLMAARYKGALSLEMKDALCDRSMEMLRART